MSHIEDLSNEEILHIKQPDAEYLQFRKLLEYPEIIHAFTLKRYGMNFKSYRDRKQEMKAKYQVLGKYLGFSEDQIVNCFQSHTDQVVDLDLLLKEQRNFDYLQNVDGLLTTNNQEILSITVADCINLLLWDPVKKVIADVHSGWKGTIQKIAIKAVQKMLQEKGCSPQNIWIFIGPSIRPCHFEVQEDVASLFKQTFVNENMGQDWIKFIGVINGKEKWSIDTVKINKKMLQKQGILAEHIVDSHICTVCHADQFHSYRADKEAYGLNIGMIGLK